jgi:hypothetical protein
VTATIRLLGVLVPLGLLVGLPLGLAMRALRRRRQRRLFAQAEALEGVAQ